MSNRRAYSYIRFSTPEQLKGDSLRRQTEASRRYAEQHGLILDENLTFRDLGVSAFRGRNARTGALGVFVEAVKTGRVAPGSFLLVESLDRLSRATPLEALDLLRSVMGLGITVVTMMDGLIYTQENIGTDFFKLFASLSIMFRANEESATKSKRGKAAWETKRKRAADNGSPLTTLAPAWIVATKDQVSGRVSYNLIPERARIVARIFEMTLDGIGAAAIARRFNGEGVPTFGEARAKRKGDGWHESYIKKIVFSDAAWGAYQPMHVEVHPETGKKARVADGPLIEGYYPAAVDRTIWLQAEKARVERRIPTGPKGDRKGNETVSNLFTGLLRCGRCSAPMHFIDKGSDNKGGKKLVCSNARRGMANCKPVVWWPYPETEGYILALVKGIDWRELFPTVYARCQEAINRLEADQVRIADDLKKTDAGIEAVVSLLIDRPDSDALKARLDRLEKRKGEALAKLRSTEAELKTERERQANVEANISDAQQALAKWRVNATADARFKMASVLKKTLQEISLRPEPRIDRTDKVGLLGCITITLRDAEAQQRLAFGWVPGSPSLPGSRRWFALSGAEAARGRDALREVMQGKPAVVSTQVLKALKEFARQRDEKHAKTSTQKRPPSKTVSSHKAA